jgi:hypothetical protein
MPESIEKGVEPHGAVREHDSLEDEHGNSMFDGLRCVGQFMSTLQTRLRFGQASRVPLRLLRLELEGDAVECEWIARPPDVWDAEIPVHVSARNESWQALDDALTVRQLIFSSIPQARRAILRAYRRPQHPSGLIIEGKVTAGEEPVRVLSVTMRAKLNGFRFCIENGVLLPLLAD